jgi:hypothetical protein
MSQREADNDSGIERKILGNIIINPEILPLMDFLRPEDFSRREHQTIYEMAFSLMKQGVPADFITLAEELEKQNKLDEIGGARYLSSLLQFSDGPFPSEMLYPNDTLYPGSPIERLMKLREVESKKQADTVILYNQEELTHPDVRHTLACLSPGFSLLKKILEEPGSFLDRLHWRDFEELIANLLEKDGYQVQLGSGTKDGGKDIIAMKELEGHGWFMSVWQAKKLHPGNKVELSVIRELADTRHKQNASKGIIVTSTYLTRGDLNRVAEDRFLLGKIDRDDLLQWIQRVKRRYR